MHPEAAGPPAENARSGYDRENLFGNISAQEDIEDLRRSRSNLGNVNCFAVNVYDRHPRLIAQRSLECGTLVPLSSGSAASVQFECKSKTLARRIAASGHAARVRIDSGFHRTESGCAVIQSIPISIPKRFSRNT
jgi:hypothetical protein